MPYPLFKIRNLSCRYSEEGRTVLEIPELDIPAGKVVFIVGVSGVGKSTILETLGMMNNTLASNSNLVFEYQSPKQKNPRALRSLWERKDDEAISNFRSKEFSFIFQDTNLMKNFSAWENIYLPALLRGRTLGQARDKAKNIIKAIFKEDLDESKMIYHLSGGQRQRLSFARAMVSEFSVLFCDEPTGNLDRFNSVRLFEVLKNHIVQEQKSAIVVSHDLELSAKFADVLIHIRKIKKPKSSADETESISGLIDDESVYINNGQHWDVGGQKLNASEFQDHLVQLLNKDNNLN